VVPVFVPDAAGRELFRGGITSRRGGEDENPGRQQLVRALARGTGADAASPPVFGCEILEPSTTPGAI
jgi:hypothetical protein